MTSQKISQKTSLAYQLYSSRNFPPLGQTLMMLADLGYEKVEGYGALMSDDAALRELEAGLASSGLTMPTAHFSFDDVKNDPQSVIDLAKRLGISAVIIPYLQPDERPADAAGWAVLAADIAEAGKPIRDAGLSYGWHNHDFEFFKLASGEYPIDLIMAAGDHIMLEFDVAWAVMAGEDPLVWLDKYGRRTIAAHIKDIAPKGENIDEDGWADVGHGRLDWKGLSAAIKAHNVPHLIMEHDNPSDHRRFASRSLEAMRAFEAG